MSAAESDTKEEEAAISELGAAVEAVEYLKLVATDELFNLSIQHSVFLDIRPRKERVANGILGFAKPLFHFEVDISATAETAKGKAVDPCELVVDTTDSSSVATKRMLSVTEWMHVLNVCVICSENNSFCEVLCASDSLHSKARVAHVCVFIWGIGEHSVAESPFGFMRLRSRRSVNYPNCIFTDGLFLGDEFAATDPLAVSDLNITAIVNASDFAGTPFAAERVEDTFKELFTRYSKDTAYIESLRKAKQYFGTANGGHGVRYLEVSVVDTGAADIAQHFDDVCAFVDEHLRSGGNVLVHCLAGMSRSATLLLAYLIKARRMTLLDAYSHTVARRPEIDPNSGFLRQLSEWESKHLGETTFDQLSAMTHAPTGLRLGLARSGIPFISSDV